MKKLLFVCVLMTGLFLGCTQTQNVKSSVEGAWEVVGWKTISDDTVRAQLGKTFTGTEMKIWSKDCFNFVGYYDLDTTYFDNFGGGTYSLEGTHYEESYLYFSMKSMVGTTQKLLLEIRGDTLIQTWPCNDNWQIDSSNYSVQILVRKDRD